MTSSASLRRGLNQGIDGATPNFAHPQDVLHTINIVSGILTIGLVAPFVLARLYIRLFITRLFVTEDCRYKYMYLDRMPLTQSRVLSGSLGRFHTSFSDSLQY